jgi:hypothetical protein
MAGHRMLEHYSHGRDKADTTMADEAEFTDLTERWQLAPNSASASYSRRARLRGVPAADA